jgi:hypothetical protein
MKAAALALLLSAAALTGAQAETYVTGFNPRFGTTPSNPDEPNYRPPSRPPHQFDFSIGVDVDIDDWRHDDRRRRHKHKR